MKINTKSVQPTRYTHEGAKASRITAEQELRRTVMACMLWENNFYESGQSVADRIGELVPKCRPEFVAACAYHARTDMKLRHAPLLLVAHMTVHEQHKKLVGKLLPDIIQRADEIAEFVAIYFHIGSKTLSSQVKKGLAAAFAKFDEYALAKYNRDKDWKLRDVLHLAHAKPTDAQGITKEQRKAALKRGEKLILNPHEDLFRKLVDSELAVPNTWETRLSSGEDKRKVFTELMESKELGALAFLRNLRNMVESGVDMSLIESYADNVKVDRVLPFRFVAAARHVPSLEPVLERMMAKCIAGMEKLPGRTLLLVDVSGSMKSPLSSKSDMARWDAAYGLAILLREMCESIGIFSFSNQVMEIPLRRGFALRDAIHNSQPHGGTYMGRSVQALNQRFDYDRIIVLTDEQSRDTVPDPKGKGYVINVASDKNGIGYGPWTKIDGWSEACIRYVTEYEKMVEEEVAS